ncbi:MAG: tail fiber domain-containing protein [Acidobacteriia bacterium]|nr:tail fiber domain-containing protein [Terriglobia bacterium]
MLSSFSGHDNTAVGTEALPSNFNGSNNVAIGNLALRDNTYGNNNIAIGDHAGIGVSGTSNNIYIGSVGLPYDNGVIRIGAIAFPIYGTQTSFFAAGIRGVTTGNNNAIPVVIDSNGQLGTISSSRRFKEEIRDMGDASTNLMRLRPVTFRYQKPFADGSKPVQYGLIAEEVAEVYPDLVAHSADGQIETVKYQVLDSMLLNELQKEHQKVEQLESRLATLEKLLAGK